MEIGNVTVVPAWLKYAKGTPVYIEPGMAFGTGNHETTALCVSLMQDVGIKDKRVIDMGCGSGILGITAAVLGAKSVLLSDLDPLATEATEHNARLNGVEKFAKSRAETLTLTAKKPISCLPTSPPTCLYGFTTNSAKLSATATTR
ncbi:MAG: 50S ribosomal protein L11 methyltransferase [Christensenellales bacterium]